MEGCGWGNGWGGGRASGELDLDENDKFGKSPGVDKLQNQTNLILKLGCKTKLK